MNAVEFENLERGYGGPPVLKGLNLRVPVGHVYGFLGRNGAGKTTAIKMMAGLMRPCAGSVRVLGGDPWSFGAPERSRVGYLSETQNLPPTMRVRSIVEFCAPLYERWDTGLCESLLSRFGIDPTRRIAKLSLGQQRLVGFAMAIAPNPDLLILDEPAANLDVVARREFLDEILELIREGGKTVFFSTHVLSDVERIADSVGILRGGSLLVDEPLDELKETFQKVRLFAFSGEIPKEVPGAMSLRRSGDELSLVLRIRTTGDLERLASGLRCQAEAHPLPLEDLFIELTRNPL
jgi:ABC-2 type transport system ATP-binding protein